MRARRPRPPADRPAAFQHLIDTPKLQAGICTDGYVSGVAAGSLLDKATGARDLGFGLSIVDFLLEPADPRAPIPAGQYDFGNAVHGNLAKRYVEGPQICTQAKRLTPRIAVGDGFTAVTTRYRWHVPYAPRTQAGSVWEQTLLFHRDWRYFLSADRVTTVSESPGLVFRVDLPGHIKHSRGNTFEHVYLSYHGPQFIPSTEFGRDFAPDERFLYRRGQTPKPERFIRAYQVDRAPGSGEGPWLAGMTLNPDDVSEAWCHQRGYVCMIQELGGRPTQRGDTFGACYAIGWFDGVAAMEAVYDQYRGWSGLELTGPADAPTGFRGLRASELTALEGWDQPLR